MKHTKVLLCIAAILFAKTAFSQKVYTYYLDPFLNIANRKKAVFKAKGQRVDTLFKVDCYGNKDVLKITACFTDSLLITLHGKFQSFYDNGILQSQGVYLNGKKNGVWESWDDAGYKIDSVIYRSDTRLLYSRYSYVYKTTPAWLMTYQLTDEIRKTFFQQEFLDNGSLVSEIFFANDTAGVLKRYNKDNVTIDTVVSRKESTPSFAGGNIEWARYVQRSLNGFNPADNSAPNGKFQVIVRFIVDEEGNISNVMPETNWGYGMEDAAVRIIRNGPKWMPAELSGKKVISFRRQPVTFIVEGL